MIKNLCMLAFFPIVSALLAAVPPDTCRQETWVTNGTVHTIAPAGDRVYIGGNFSHVGPYTGSGVPINSSTGAVEPGHHKIDRIVNAVCSDGGGGWFLGCSVDFFDSITHNNIIHILSDGSLDPAWNSNVNGAIWSLVVGGGTLYVGGDFISIGSQPRNNIAAFEIATGSLTDWNPNANHGVYFIAMSGTTIYASGEFDSIGGQKRKYIAALDAVTGTATSWYPNTSAFDEYHIYAIAISGATIYVGGLFDSIGGQNRNCIAALDDATGNATDWNPNANNPVHSLAVCGTTIYAGGWFTNIGGANRKNIAALDAATGNATDWNPNADHGVYFIAVSGTTIYAGGDFDTIGGRDRNCIAALDAATGNATDWNPNMSGVVSAIAVSGTTVYVGGIFKMIGGLDRHNIAALDAATGDATSWYPNADGEVYSIAVSGKTIYIGGEFTRIGQGIYHPHFAQFGDFDPASTIPSRHPHVEFQSVKFPSIKLGRAATGLFIAYNLPAAVPVSINLYTLQGRLLTSIADAYYKPGSYRIPIDMAHFSNGFMIMKFKAGNFRSIQRMPSY